MIKIELLKYPYPYQAALAICSDIDGTRLQDFIAMHRFLNTDQDTELGKGLQLPIADSFWMTDRPHLPDAAFSYFNGSDGTVSDAAPIIRDGIRAGIIDVMHGYGNFGSRGDFTRTLAARN